VSADSLYVDSEWCRVIVYTRSQCWIHSKHATATGRSNTTALLLLYCMMVATSRTGDHWPSSSKYVAPWIILPRRNNVNVNCMILAHTAKYSAGIQKTSVTQSSKTVALSKWAHLGLDIPSSVKNFNHHLTQHHRHDDARSRDPSAKRTTAKSTS